MRALPLPLLVESSNFESPPFGTSHVCTISSEYTRERHRRPVNGYRCNGIPRPRPISFSFHAASFASCAEYIKHTLSLSLSLGRKHGHSRVLLGACLGLQQEICKTV
ncbi:hypothetical protein CIPAW_09G021900 [Carya illinoinensis]|uniref:Uncharacterized protein n=1 Tax=Carya illinoinensis TaxID=32201 RepID=A0A8T1PHW2_CARIL|nr:hypothetical protein CIPAW_09G021900 [Carya illinoinensis]